MSSVSAAEQEKVNNLDPNNEQSTISDVDPPLQRYRDNSIEGFRNGACLDLRVRMAANLLEHSPLFHGMGLPSGAERNLACAALDIATELFAESERRSLIEPFKPFEQDKHLQGHVERQVDFQMHGQITSLKKQREGQSAIAPVAGIPPFSPRHQ